MKKAFIILLTFCALATAQSNKPRIAVYSRGDMGPGELRMLSTEIQYALVKSGRYDAIERSETFIAEVDRELVTQMSGSVDDSQMAELGKRAGAQYVCIVDVTAAFGAYQVSTRIINVKSTIVENMGKASGDIKSVQDATAISGKVIASMFGGEPGGSAGGAGTAGAGAAAGAPGASIEMVRVKGGAFNMGCSGSGCPDNEKTVRSVTVSDFYIGKYEVTQRLWTQVMGSNPSRVKGDNLPVTDVSWIDIQSFLSRLNSATGKRYRLPTEAEWEYAARGGAKSKGYMYAGGNSLDDAGWYSINSGGKTHPAGSKEPNELGIHDMSGNVQEWVGDWFGAYKSSDETNPKGPESGTHRLMRGGGWRSEAQACRTSARNDITPGSRRNDLGFRLALTE